MGSLERIVGPIATHGLFFKKCWLTLSITGFHSRCQLSLPNVSLEVAFVCECLLEFCDPCGYCKYIKVYL